MSLTDELLAELNQRLDGVTPTSDVIRCCY